jgi:hypothetical protein
MLYAVSMTLKTWWRLRLQKPGLLNAVKAGYLIPVDDLKKVINMHDADDNPIYAVFHLLSFGSKKQINYQVAISTEQLIHPYGLPYQWHNFLFADHYEVWPDPIDPKRVTMLIKTVESESSLYPESRKFLLIQTFLIKKEKLNAS